MDTVGLALAVRLRVNADGRRPTTGISESTRKANQPEKQIKQEATACDPPARSAGGFFVLIFIPDVYLSDIEYLFIKPFHSECRYFCRCFCLTPLPGRYRASIGALQARLCRTAELNGNPRVCLGSGWGARVDVVMECQHHDA
jgi:hypothetical protein